MTIDISNTLEEVIKERAKRFHVSVNDVVQQALGWYVSIDPELLEEFAEIEAAHGEALENFEDSLT